MRRRVSGRKTPRVGISAAQAADVTSSNVVGFHTISLVGGGNYTMLGINWEKVGGGAIAINDLWEDPAAAGFVGATTFTSADQIQVWQDGDYTTYYLYDSGRGREIDNKWFEVGARAPTEDVIAPGAGVWILSNSEEASFPVTLKGEVPASPAGQSIVDGDYVMLANVYPAAIPLNGFDWGEQGAFGATTFTSADQIQVWVDGDYTTYYLYDSGRGREIDNKWFEVGARAPTEDAIPAGVGFWYLGHSDWTLTIPAPAAN